MLRETVGPRDSLYRRIFHFFVKDDGNVSSAAFKKKNKIDPKISVDLARLTTPSRALTFGLPGMGLAELSAAVPLDLGLAVTHCPDAETGNDAHCVITGEHTRTTCHVLAENATVVIQPPRA